MSDFERINGPRVEKLVGALEVIDKSAKSNKSRPDEIHDLLKPVFTKLLHVTGKYPEPGPVAPVEQGITTGEIAVVSSGTGGRSRVPQWAHIREMAEQASLEDLTVAMAVYINRIDEELKGR